VLDLDTFEDGLVAAFQSHPVLEHLDRLSDADFAALLLQRRFLSLAFTPAYDLAIDLLSDDKGLQIARTVLREEYPGNGGLTPSHREDMTEDLLRLGVVRADLVATRPTRETAEVITTTLELIAEAGLDDLADAQLLTILRFWGEVLVSVEYGCLWRRMEPLLVVNGENRSRFYYPHHVHDAKVRPLEAASPLSATHSDQLGVRLWQLLNADPARRDHARKMFMATEEHILAIKTRFYDQFTDLLATSS